MRGIEIFQKLSYREIKSYARMSYTGTPQALIMNGDKFLFFGWVDDFPNSFLRFMGETFSILTRVDDFPRWMIFMAFKKSNNEIKTNIYLRDTQVLSLDIFYSLADKVLLFYCKSTDYKNKYEGLYV